MRDIMQGQQKCVVDQEHAERREIRNHYMKYWWLYGFLETTAGVVVMAAIAAAVWLAMFL